MVFDFLRKAPVEAVPERKASAVGRVIAWGNAGRVAWSPRDTASLTRTGFQANPSLLWYASMRVCSAKS